MSRPYRISFHNHLPVPRNRFWEPLALHFVRRLVHQALEAGLDVVCLNQWGTVPSPFFLHEVLLRMELGDGLEVTNKERFLVVSHRGRRLVLVQGLEIGVVTDRGEPGEVIVLGVERDFPVQLGEGPRFEATVEQKRALWRSTLRHVEAQGCWLFVAPHPCFHAGFGPAVTRRLLRDGIIDTFERFNSILELIDPAVNRQARRLEATASRSIRRFVGITGNDGLDPATALTSYTSVVLELDSDDPEVLLEALAASIRTGEVEPVGCRAGVGSLLLKVLHSQRSWWHLVRWWNGRPNPQGDVCRE